MNTIKNILILINLHKSMKFLKRNKKVKSVNPLKLISKTSTINSSRNKIWNQKKKSKRIFNIYSKPVVFYTKILTKYKLTSNNCLSNQIRNSRDNRNRRILLFHIMHKIRNSNAIKKYVSQPLFMIVKPFELVSFQ